MFFLDGGVSTARQKQRRKKKEKHPHVDSYRPTVCARRKLLTEKTGVAWGGGGKSDGREKVGSGTE